MDRRFMWLICGTPATTSSSWQVGLLRPFQPPGRPAHNIRNIFRGNIVRSISALDWWRQSSKNTVQKAPQEADPAREPAQKGYWVRAHYSCLLSPAVRIYNRLL